MKTAQQIFIVAKQRRLFMDGIDMIELFQHVEPFIKNNFPIQWAAKNGEVEMVRHLLNNILVDPSANGNSAIRHASENGHVEVVRLLLTDKPVDPSAFAIQMASENGHIEVVKLLLTDLSTK
jgi:ankyrin repeat protein